MLRQIMAALAMLAGLVTGAALVIATEFGRGRTDYPLNPFANEPFTPLSWSLGVAQFVMPISGLLMLMSLIVLEWLQPRLKMPRIAFFVMGALAIASVVGGALVYLAATAFGFEASMFKNIVGFDTPQAALTNVFLLPMLVSVACYLVLSRGVKPGAPDPLPEEPYSRVEAPTASVPDPEHQLDTGQLIAIMTSPRERIGQRAFLYAIRIWFFASSIWFTIPFLFGPAMGLEEQGVVLLSASGWLVLFWFAFCMTANRLHDLSVSALWAAAPLMAAAAVALMESGDVPFGRGTLLAFLFAGFFSYGLMAAILLLQKGDPYPNRYGSRI